MLLLTVDALRADVIRDESKAHLFPYLTRLRRRSAWFSKARATSPATAPSVASIMTGKYYSQLRWTPQRIHEKVKYTLHEDSSTRVAGLLDAAGVRTISLATAAGPTQSTGETSGFAEEVLVRSSSEDYPREIERRLRAFRGGQLFVYGHFIEPHHPYDAPGETDFASYLNEVARVDRALGAIAAAVERSGLTERTLMLVTGDHGEAFGEHGTRHHAVSVFDELLRVPLLVQAPGVANGEIDVPVSGIDLGPTLLDLFGLATPAGFMGESLVPLLRGEATGFGERPIIADSGRRMQSMVFPDELKVILDTRHGVVSLFDLERDPLELEDMADLDPDLACARSNELRQLFSLVSVPGYDPPYRP